MLAHLGGGRGSLHKNRQSGPRRDLSRYITLVSWRIYSGNRMETVELYLV